MKRKAIIPLALGLCVGLAAVKLAVDTIRKAKAAGRTAETVKVVRSRQDINPHETITAEMVEVVETAESIFAPANDRISNVEDVVGRVSAKAIPERVAVLKPMLAPEGTRPGMVGRIPAGYRAVSVKIDEVTGVAYQINPGDWVDVIVVMDIATSTRGGKETIAEVILQRVQVAAIGRGTDTGAGESAGKMKPAKSATLLVREEDVPKLHLAATRGKVTFAMRGDDKETTDNPARADMGDVIPGLHPSKSSTVDSTGPSLMEMMNGLFVDSAGSGTKPGDSRLLHREPEPYAVLVVRGSPGTGGPASVEQITFEDVTSPNITDVSKGHPTRASSRMGVSRNPDHSSSDRSPVRTSRSHSAEDETKPNSSGE